MVYVVEVETGDVHVGVGSQGVASELDIMPTSLVKLAIARYEEEAEG